MGKHLSAQISSNCSSNVLNKSEKPAHPIWPSETLKKK